MLKSLLKLVDGAEILPAGITATTPQESLPDNDENYKYTHKIYSPLMYGQINVSDKILTNQPSELEYLV